MQSFNYAFKTHPTVLKYLRRLYHNYVTHYIHVHVRTYTCVCTHAIWPIHISYYTSKNEAVENSKQEKNVAACFYAHTHINIYTPQLTSINSPAMLHVQILCHLFCPHSSGGGRGWEKMIWRKDKSRMQHDLKWLHLHTYMYIHVCIYLCSSKEAWI